MKIDLQLKITDGECIFEYSEINKAWELCAITENGGKYVIAFFRNDSEGYYMKTVGNRFFGHDAFNIAKTAINMLNELFDAEEHQ